VEAFLTRHILPFVSANRKECDDVSVKYMSVKILIKFRTNVIPLGYGLDDRGSRVRFPAGAGNFFLTTASRAALGPTQSPIKWVRGALSLGVKRPRDEDDNSPPSSAEVKITWRYTSIPRTRLHGMVLSRGTTLPLHYTNVVPVRFRGV
jgi:hypothetical protein